jgi:hypothetical protein
MGYGKGRDIEYDAIRFLGRYRPDGWVHIKEIACLRQLATEEPRGEADVREDLKRLMYDAARPGHLKDRYVEQSVDNPDLYRIRPA